MPTLYGAVAYRKDAVGRYQTEIDTWERTQTLSELVGCPRRCGATYCLIVEMNAPDQQVYEYVDALHAQMERDDCPNHRARITVPPPNGGNGHS